MQKPLESLYMIISKRINRKTNLRFFRFYNAIIKIEKVHRETGVLSFCSGSPLPACAGFNHMF